jgi:hypothetical protein
VATNETTDKKGQPESTGHNTNEPNKPWIVPRIWKTICKWWQDLKDPGVSNRTIALATVIIAIATGFTWREVHSGSAQTDKLVTAATTIQAALGTANKNNQTALAQTLTQSKTALDASIANSQLDQRAWLGFGEMQAPFEVGKQFLVHFSFMNNGKTPALNVSAKHEVRFIKVGESLQFTYKDVSGEPSRTIILPNAGMKADFIANGGQITSPPMVEAIRANQMRIFLYGKATYDDVFGGHHWVTFCDGFDSRGWGACPEYNETGDTQSKNPN